MNQRTIIFALVVLMLGTGEAWAKGKTKTDPIRGFWYTENREAGVQLYSCDVKVCGRFYWLKDNAASKIARDVNNPDPALRHRSLCGLQFMGDFTVDELGHYANGWIYSPEHGDVFKAEMTLTDADTLDVHGYVLVPILGDSQTWHRAAHMPSCGAKSL